MNNLGTKNQLKYPFDVLDTTYSTVSSLVDSLVNHEVDGILLDAYTSGSYKSFLKQAGVLEKSLVEFPRTYGVVLSGGLARVNEEVCDYVFSNEDKILNVLEMYTTKLNVSSLLVY